MNMITTLAVYCFFDNKPNSLEGFYLKGTKLLRYFENTYP